MMSTVDQPRAPKQPARVTRRELIAVLAVAALALIFAVSSIAIGLTALGWAAGARSEVRVASQVTRPVPPAATPGGGAAAPSAAPSPSAGTPSPAAPSASFAAAYTGTPLKIRPSCTDAGRAVDLDEPKVGATDGVDVGYHGCNGSDLSLAVTPDAQASTIRSGQAGVQDCADAIRIGAASASIEPVAGQSLCVLTAGNTQQAVPHYVLLHIDDIAEDGTITATATAWTAPG